MVAAEAAEGGEDDAERPGFLPEMVVVQSAAEHEVGDPHNNSEHHGQQLKIMHHFDKLSTGGKIRPNARARQLVVRVDVGVRVEGKFSEPFPGHEAQNRPED
ncbi:hypothetical protein KL925_004191 [Ogataea polymorpha]|nr:hypothetical protein KL936_004003 [Ogataea polymorpha]KAG7892183.1 hypothetical protein KL908_003788 [Ogataea polymorpha]KAG7925781.1 hypothetical protein KL925_004191 [Ogataea polymorpha]